MYMYPYMYMFMYMYYTVQSCVSARMRSPISGTDSDVAGTSSAISSMNMENARNTDRPRLIFSPDVGGNQNVNSVSTDNIIHGAMMLNL